MTYLDFYLVPVHIENKAAYEELARASAQVLREYGAIRVVECWLDESGPEAATFHSLEARLESGQYRTFVEAAGAGRGETVVLSFVEWPDKATRDRGLEKVTSDPRMQFENLPPTFDGKRLIAAGFRPMLDVLNRAGG